MPTLPQGTRVLLCTQAMDMRKSFDGLIAATKTVLGEDPLSGNLFVFVNRKATQAKVLYWSRGGFCVWAKRLERGRFAASRSTTSSMPMTDTQLMMWLDGIELTDTYQRRRFVLPDRTQARPMSATMRA